MVKNFRDQVLPGFPKPTLGEPPKKTREERTAAIVELAKRRLVKNATRKMAGLPIKKGPLKKKKCKGGACNCKGGSCMPMRDRIAAAVSENKNPFLAGRPSDLPIIQPFKGHMPPVPRPANIVNPLASRGNPFYNPGSRVDPSILGQAMVNVKGRQAIRGLKRLPALPTRRSARLRN